MLERRSQKLGEARSALLIIDMISDFDFEDGKELFANALPAAKCISDLRSGIRSSGAPVIYVNDNYGKWQEDFAHQVTAIEKRSTRCNQIIELLRPDKDDYYVLKPHRSAFYETPLMVLLESMHVTELFLTGVTTDICILFTAHDAYMRGFGISVPTDCCAAVKPAHHNSAISLLKRVMDADVRDSTTIQSARESKA